MRCLAQQGIRGNRRAGELVVRILERLIKEEDRNSSRKSNTSHMYTLAMKASPSSADAIFALMKSRSKQDQSRARSSLSNRAAMIIGLAKNGQQSLARQLLWKDAPVSLHNTGMHLQDNPEEAEAILVKMIEENLRFDLQYTAKPNLKSFRIAIRKWA